MTTEPTGVATWSDFERVGIRVGTVRRVEAFPEARKPAYKLWIDFGPFGIRQSSAQLTALYQPDDLVGRQVVCATGLGPKRAAGCKSEGLGTGLGRGAGALIPGVPEPEIADRSPPSRP